MLIEINIHFYYSLVQYDKYLTCFSYLKLGKFFSHCNRHGMVCRTYPRVNRNIPFIFKEYSERFFLIGKIIKMQVLGIQKLVKYFYFNFISINFFLLFLLLNIHACNVFHAVIVVCHCQSQFRGFPNIVV